MKKYTDLLMEQNEVLTEGVDKLMKHPLMKGLRKPNLVHVDDDLSGEKIPMLDFGSFKVGEDAGTYYIETSKGYLILADLVMTQLAPAVAAIIRMEKS